MIADIPACICTSEFTGAMCQVGTPNYIAWFISYAPYHMVVYNDWIKRRQFDFSEKTQETTKHHSISFGTDFYYRIYLRNRFPCYMELVACRFDIVKDP